MRYYLFLDDVRVPKDVTWVTLPDVIWTIVRNYEQFVETIAKYGMPELISFDHDLGIEHYLEYQRITKLREEKIDYSKFMKKTGYDCAKWLVEYCLDRRVKLPKVVVHTQNTIGMENISSLFDSFARFA